MGQGKKPTEAELAAILAHAGLYGDKSACEKFGCSLRSLQRYRKKVQDGGAPVVAQLVAEQKQRANARCADLLTDTFESSLRRLKEVLPEAVCRDVVGAVKILGDLKLTRTALGDDPEDGQQPSDNCERPATPPLAGAAKIGAKGQAGSAGAGIH